MLNFFTNKNNVDYYKNAVTEIGLWNSELAIFKRYILKDANILDIGCGAGRISVGLYKQGYKNVTGIDFSQDMIKQANNIKKQYNYNINYQYGNVTKLEFNNNTFNSCIFAFNGLVLMPGRENRIKAIQEINRVLKTDGIFIFTTDDYRLFKGKQHKAYWKEQLQKWSNGNQDKRIIDYGDVIYDTDDGQIFFHFNTIEEIVEMLVQNGFKVLDTFDRNERYKEPKNVMEFCPECRFWIAQKII